MFLALKGQLEGVTHDAVATLLGKDALLYRDLKVGVAVESSTGFRVFAFVVFANDAQINVPRRTVLDRRINALEQPHRPQVYILLEGATNGYQQSPKRNVIGHAWIANCSQKDRVKGTQLIKAIKGHHFPGL